LEVAYEWIPDFCTHCQIIDHDVTAYHWLIPHKFVEKVDHGNKLVHFLNKTIKKYVEKHNTGGK
jgi:hypothetical protein